METTQLCEIFMKTLDPNNDVRTKAEESLKEVSGDPRFIFSLFSMISNPEVIDPFRLIAATTLKNNVKRRSTRTSSDPFSDEEKKFLWDNLPELILRSHTLTSAQLLVSLSLLIDYCSTDEYVTALFKKVVAFTSSNDIKSVHSGFSIFHILLKSTAWFGIIESENRDIFSEQKMLPKMLLVAEELAGHDSNEAGDLIKLVIKTYYILISKHMITSSIFHPDYLLRWCKVFTSVISKKLNTSLSTEELENSNWSKAVKWSYKCVTFLMNRCDETSEFSTEERKLFRNHYAVEIYKVMDEQLKTFMSGVPITRKVKQQMAIYLISCVYHKSTWLMLKMNFMNIVSMFILPIIVFDDELEDLWNSNPAEYILEGIEIAMGEYFGPRSAALKLLQVLTRERYGHVFMHLMSYLTQMLGMGYGADQSLETAKQRYGLYMMASVLAPLALNKSSPVRGEMEQFATTIIIPDMKSNYTFIRQAACNVLSKLDTLEWKDEKNLIFAVESILENLAHPEIQVSVFATSALRSIICNALAMDYIRPKVHEIVQILQNLNKEMDLDEISDTIEIIVSNFYTELMPFITSLVRNLIEAIMQNIDKYSESAANCSDSSELTDVNYDIINMVQSHLKIIITYVMTMKDHPAVVLELDNIIAPAVKAVFDKGMVDAYADVFETLEVIAYCSKSISHNLWAFMPTVTDIVLSDPEEHVDSAANLIDHYIDYGRSTLIISPDHRVKIYNIVEVILTHDNYSTTSSCKIRACEIIESLALNLKGEINEAVPFFLNLVLPHIMKMSTKTTSAFLVFALEVVINLIYYNPQLTLPHLESLGAMSHFFILWVSTLHKFKRVHDKKLCILAISEILSTPVELLPQSLNDKTTFIRLIQALVELLEEYPKALSEYEKEKKKNDENCDSDDQDESDDTSLGGQSDGDIHKDATDDYGFNNYEDEDEDADEDDWDADELSEDIYFVTEITKFDPYSVVKSTLQTPNVATRLNQYLTDEERMKLVNVMEVGEMLSIKNTGFSLIK